VAGKHARPYVPNTSVTSVRSSRDNVLSWCCWIVLPVVAAVACTSICALEGNNPRRFAGPAWVVSLRIILLKGVCSSCPQLTVHQHLPGQWLQLAVATLFE